MNRLDECVAFIRVYADEIEQAVTSHISEPDNPLRIAVTRRAHVIREYVTEIEHERHMERHREIGDPV